MTSRLNEICKKFGIPVEAALNEKAVELELRYFLRCVPNERLRDEQVVGFLTEVLGHAPPPGLAEAVRLEQRGPRLNDGEWGALERQQHSRCATCGVFLEPLKFPQVDHIVPIANGGKHTLSNLRILCRKCNQGKKHFMGWQQAMPFLIDSGELSPQLRFAVLSRFGGRCQTGCGAFALTSALVVRQLVPTARGGRWIFDNLTVFCQECNATRERELDLTARNAISSRLGGVAATRLSERRSASFRRLP
jgi:5-methylcytosine-specific restriction endonuclease McrA